MILDRRTGRVAESVFSHLREFLREGDLLVVNNSRVFPARLIGRKETGGRVDLLLLRPCHAGGGGVAGGLQECAGNGQDWECLARASGRLKAGQGLWFAGDLRGEVLGRSNPGVVRVRFSKGGEDLFRFLEAFGRTPLPPYIRRGEAQGACVETGGDRERYQTVFARVSGSAAAPTAGLHFSDLLCRRLREGGIRFAEITLHVGEATFLPIRSADIREHALRPEPVFLSQEAVREIEDAKAAGRRVVAVGTTVVRCLESVATGRGWLVPGAGWADLYLVPGFRFQVVDALITNFHLPCSSLLVLVCAFAGRESVLGAYREAVRRGYRFFSYGDCMLIQ
jgi:S-adenosylmethionine:tRNA ribosyltransferase-isomerase